MSKLTEADLELLRDTAVRFFDEQLPVDALRRLRDEGDDTGFNRAIWREMAEMGWTGILIDEKHGGIDPGYTAIGSILEQSGRTLAASPLISTAVIGAPNTAMLRLKFIQCSPSEVSCKMNTSTSRNSSTPLTVNVTSRR